MRIEIYRKNTMEKISSQISYVWSVICVFFGAIDWNLIAVIVGIILSIGTFLTNRYYKRREDRRSELETRAKIKYYQRLQKINENENEIKK